MPRRRLGSEAESSFTCGPFMGSAAIENVPVADNLITVDRLFGPIHEAIEYRSAAAVSRATTAIHGLAGLLIERRIPRATLFEETTAEWSAEPAQALRTAIYTMIGSTPEHPQIVREDSPGQEDPHKTLIVKGQASASTPLYLVETAPTWETRRLEVIDGRHIDLVTAEVNAFSLAEYTLAASYINDRTTDPALSRRILAHANRYTTPDVDGLYGALQFEAHGPHVLNAWPTDMAVYSQRKGTLPL